MQTSHGHALDLNDRGQGVMRYAPSNPDDYQERMARLQASADRDKAKRLGYVPCPHPGDNDDTQNAYREGMAYGYRTNGDWDGMGRLGVAYAGGADMGRFWRHALA